MIKCVPEFLRRGVPSFLPRILVAFARTKVAVCGPQEYLEYTEPAGGTLGTELRSIPGSPITNKFG